MTTGEPTSRTDVAALCPLAAFGQLLGDVADAAEPLDGSPRSNPTVGVAVRRSIANAIRANAALLDGLSALARGQIGGVRVNNAGSPVAPRSSPLARPLVLAGLPGELVAGAFVVQNARPVVVDAIAVLDSFVDQTGALVALETRFEPERIVLNPGAEAVVKLHVRVPPMAAAVGDLTSTISIPSLSDTVVPVVLRVMHSGV